MALQLLCLVCDQMVPEAVRRGRKIKCRECGGKGATLGCLNRFCRSSFHLSCARNCGCELQVTPPSLWPPVRPVTLYTLGWLCRCLAAC